MTFVSCRIDYYDVYIVYKRFQTSESPLQSSLLGIDVVGGIHNGVISIKLSAIEAKYAMLPVR